jgi:metal-dependent amidase/aminoacylase/carboxypeptidase family protein
VNHAEIVDLGKRVTEAYIGPDAWQTMANPSMGGEDFAYYIAKHPGAIFRLGMGLDSAPLHSPLFNFNDKALKNGILFLVGAALESLRGGRA